MAEQNLDGKTPVKPVPFDAHEQMTRNAPVAAEIAEYPKAVAHVDKPGAPEGHKEPIIVHSAEEEAAYHAANAVPDVQEPADPARA